MPSSSPDSLPSSPVSTDRDSAALQALLDVLCGAEGDGAVLLAADGALLAANESWRRWMGPPPAGLWPALLGQMGEPGSLSVPPLELGAAGRAASGGPPWAGGPFPAVLADGRSAHFYLQAQALPQSVEQAAAVVRLRPVLPEWGDITAVPSPLLRLDPAGTVVGASWRARRLLEPLCGEMLGRRPGAWLPPRTARALRAALVSQRVAEYECLIGSGSSRRRVRLAVSPAGAGHWVVVEDVTGSRRAQAEQRVSERRRVRLVEQLEMGVMQVDEACAVHLVNRSAAELLGRPAAELVGRRCPGLLGRRSQDGGCRDCPVSAALAGGCEQASEVPCPADSGRTLRVRAIPVRGAGGVAVFLEDITRQRRLEALQQEFSSLVAHDLRLPLTVILGYAEVLSAQGGLSELQGDCVQHISEGGRRLQGLVEDLGQCCRIEAGQGLDCVLGPMDLQALVRTGVMEQQVVSPGHRFELALPPGPCPVRGDSRRLLQVLGNLLTNAVKFSPDGSVITVALQPEEGAWRLSVRDQGAGLSAEQCQRVFERHWRSGERSGSGLGLYIARHLVEAHGGRIAVQSAPAQGSTFYLSLPAIA